MQISSVQFSSLYSKTTQNISDQPDEGVKKTQQQIMNSLSPHLSDTQLEGVMTADLTDVTPEKVASRVVEFVSAGLAAAASRGASQERLDQLYNAAVKGVEQGFKEAREILNDMEGFLGSPAEQLVNDTEKLTFEELAKINPAAQAATEQVSGIVEAAASIRESMKIDLVTQDGDRVQVRFSNSQSGGFVSDGVNSVERYSESSRYKFKVEGELDPEEIDAITSLLDEVSGVAKEFFDGDVQAAFDKASALRMDTTELARFDLNLNVKSRVEVRQYQDISDYSRPERSIASRIQNWLDNSVEPVKHHRMMDRLENSLPAYLSLLEGAIDVGGKEKGLPPGLREVLADRLFG